MEKTLQFLTQIQPPRSYNHIDSLNSVAEYIAERFKQIGLEVEFQEFQVDGNIYKNVIGILNPQYQKRLLFGGHYDVCGEIEGADDNASAVAGVVQSATQLYEYREKLPFRVEFIAFVLEEPPYFNTSNMGSYIHANYLKEKEIEVIGLINYEMIGYFSDEPSSQEYPIDEMEDIYGDIGDYIAIVSNVASDAFLEKLGLTSVQSQIKIYDMILPDALSDITASDHLNYWDLGFDAVMVTDTAHFRNPNYHTEEDTLETLDIKKMGYVIDAVVQSVVDMVDKI
jgi:Zn-dependent M28 family amino/carboxypeptidase